MLGNSLSGIQCGAGIFFFFFFLASQTLSVQTCAKGKQTEPRLLITIRLDLCPLFFSEGHKMDDGGVLPLERREAGPVPVSNGLARTIQVDALLPPTPPLHDFSNLLFHQQSYKLQA